MAKHEDVTDELERIAHAMLTAKWDTRSGPRNFRVLATLLKRQQEVGASSLYCRIGLRELAVRAGLSDNDRLAKKALTDLVAGGWITYKPDQCSIGLIVPDSTDRHRISQIPDPMLVAFDNPNGSNVGTKVYLEKAVEHFTNPTDDTEWYLDKEQGYFSDTIARERLATFEASRDGYRAMTGTKSGKRTIRGMGDWIADSALVPVSSRPTPHLCDDCGVLLRYMDGRYAKTCHVCGAPKVTIMEMSEVLS